MTNNPLKNIWDEITKTSKVGLSMESLNTDFFFSFLPKLLKVLFWVDSISFIIFGDFSIFYQIFVSQQVKRCAIITYKLGIYELPHKLPNDLSLRILGN